MKQINPEARKQALAWHRNPSNLNPIELKCPHELSQEEIQAEREAIRPEFYGRIGRITARFLQTGLDKRQERGELGLVSQKGKIVDLDAIKDFDDAFLALKSTLIYDKNSTINNMRGGGEVFNEVDFNEFLTAHSLVRYKDSLRNFGLGDLDLDLLAGIDTAGSMIFKLMPIMSQFAKKQGATPEELSPLLTRSTQPIEYLASMNIDFFIAVQDKYFLNPTKIEQFLYIKNNRVFLRSIGAHEAEARVEHRPTIGCPVLFEPKQLQELWGWAVDIATKTNLLRSEPCR
jgi:hypothetical protein